MVLSFIFLKVYKVILFLYFKFINLKFINKKTLLAFLAASYNLEAAESEIRQANVEGTRNVLSLAEQLQAGILQYTSSIVVSGDYDGLFLERMYDEGQSHAAHAYFQTKFEVCSFLYILI